MRLSEQFLESLPSRETFPINRTETLEMLTKFQKFLRESEAPHQPSPDSVCELDYCYGDCGRKFHIDYRMGNHVFPKRAGDPRANPKAPGYNPPHRWNEPERQVRKGGQPEPAKEKS